MRSPYHRRYQEPFNQREVEILSLIRQGFSNNAIAQQLSLSVGTVKWYNRQVFSKLGVESRTQAIEKAIQIGLIDALQQTPTGDLAQSGGQVKTNLPAPLNVFIGREKENADLRALLQAPMPRLVTILGPGGIGKTRLALQVADEMLSHFPQGVWLADLSLVTEAANLVQFVSDSLGVRVAPGLQVKDLLVCYLRPRALLLILDNCEHLAEECARLILHLLTNCPSLRIMVTSREALLVEGEALYPLTPLSFPNPDRLPQFQSVMEYEAIQLFVERARLACPGFMLQAENARVIAWICRRLDGIPLALELAAARLGLLSVDQIQAGLADYFHLLSVKRRMVFPRYQTMRASLDWSYNLLSPEEQQLLRRLAVFSGGWTLEAAEAVCAEEPSAVLDLLNGLVNKSMVVGAAGDLLHYRLLEPIRQYALEKLKQSGEMDTLRDQHLAYFVRVAEREGPKFYTGESSRIVRLVRSDLENIRSGLGWALDRPIGDERAEWGLRLAAELDDFWLQSGLFQEGRDWVAKALDRTTNRGTQLDLVRALACQVLGGLVSLLNNQTEAKRVLDEAVSILRKSGDSKGLAMALNEKAIWTYEIDPENARQSIEESVMLARQVNDEYVLPNTLMWRGWIKRNSDIEQNPQEDFEESLQLFMASGNLQMACYPLVSLGELAFERSDLPLALRYRDQFLEYLPEVEDVSLHYFASGFLTKIAYHQGDCQVTEGILEQFLEESWGKNIVGSVLFLRFLGILLKCQGRYRKSVGRFLESIAIAQEIHDSYSVISALGWLVVVAVYQGRLEAAARLAGAVEALGATEKPLEDLLRVEFERNISDLCVSFSETAFSQAWAEGRAMTEEQVVHYARECLGDKN